MKITEKWLRELVNPSADNDVIAHKLTMAGIEVEAVHPVASKFSDIVIGEVIAENPHPDSDHLHLCKVNVGADSLLSIVCGAANVRANIKVPVALVGAKLPDGTIIKKAKLRGIESFGMICSARELGLTNTSEGIMELSPDAPIGADVFIYLDCDDHIFDLSVTPNRGDCLSVLGIAREVALLNDVALNALIPKHFSDTLVQQFPISINAPKACPHYLGRVIRNINSNAKTPILIQERLRRCGINPISPVVDITNYVMLELGQPMHAFDLSKLENAINVRYANPNETIVLLDGSTISLTEDTLVIADAKQAQALAGIMGGMSAKVTETTKDIFLECAFFDPKLISTTCQRYGLHTESSQRFAKGVDIEIQMKAMDRATELLVQIVGGNVGLIKVVQDSNSFPILPQIKLRKERISRVLGMTFSDQEITASLKKLNICFESLADGWLARPPSYRFDLNLEVDLLEELVRLKGYDKVPLQQPKAPLIIKPLAETKLTLSRLNFFMVDRGYREIITYSFIDPHLQMLLANDDTGSPVKLKNPMATNMSVMRTSLWPGLLQAALYNLNRQQSRIRLFELGTCFIADKELHQDMYLGAVAIGDCYLTQWRGERKNIDFFKVKEDLQSILKLAGVSDEITYVKFYHKALHGGRTAKLCDARGNTVGWLGELHPEIKHNLGFKQDVYLFEVNLTSIYNKKLSTYRSVSKFPIVVRDLAILLAKEIEAATVKKLIEEIGGELLQSVQLFDVYSGSGILVGQKSLAFTLAFQHKQRTLLDEEVDSLITNIVNELNARFGAILRS